jgi:hypothetical protein
MYMKTITLLLVLLFFVCFILPADTPVPNITYEQLAEGLWQMGYYTRLLIKPSDTGGFMYDWVTDEEELGWVSLHTGSIIIENGEIHLKHPLYEGGPDNLIDTGRVWLNEDKVNYSEYLKLEREGEVFYNLRKPMEPGTEMVFQGTPVVLILKLAVTNDAVRVREGPSLNYDPFALRLFDNRTSYPVNTEVYVLGRTLKKERIGDWNNYWYLISVPTHVMTPPESGLRKWAYGEFFDFKE